MIFNLVAKDNAPQVKATITREDDGAVVDLTGATVYLKFRKKGNTTTLFTITGVNDPATNYPKGIVLFNFGTNDLNIAAGFYEGEIEIIYPNTTVETIYELVNFQLRADF
tara:strand:- start:1474 stop:1803 length:330 start_codon:yes stop_codon:yes gene_type:complete